MAYRFILIVIYLVSSSEIEGQFSSYCTQNSNYRSYDGSCNNMNHPEWGTPRTKYGRILPPKYGDGLRTIALSKNGQPLPNPRRVSWNLFPDVPISDRQFTLAAMQYGQIITHDMSLNLLEGLLSTCCTDNKQMVSPQSLPQYCLPIPLPKDDPVYSKENWTCMGFIKTVNEGDVNAQLASKPAEQLSQVTHYLDLSLVYGNDKETIDYMREFKNGLLKVDKRYGQSWPLNSTNVSVDCNLQGSKNVCYYASDSRINQNTELTLLQIVYMREHNRIAAALSGINPRWNDETVFQEARKINIAQHQYITYYEWLPLFLGLDSLYAYRILYKTDSTVEDYDPSVNPNVLNEHAQGAFRHFHSLIAGRLELMTESRNIYNSIRLSDWFFRPVILETGDNFDGLTRGLCSQAQMASDEYHVKEVTNLLFRGANKLGLDLKTIDIQRNRHHGLGSYNDLRVYCGLKRATQFEDYLDYISTELVNKLKFLYYHPDDVDLIVGGSLETSRPPFLVGPSFHCILLKQFKRTRISDRFWFERPGQFTLKQLKEIKKASIARILCDNSRNIKTMQERGFVKISDSNILKNCNGLPLVNLTMWKTN